MAHGGNTPVETNYAYKNVRYDGESAGVAYLSVGGNVPYAITKLYDLGEGRTSTADLTFSVGTYTAAKKAYQLHLFDDDKNWVSYYSINADSKDINVATNRRYIALSMPLNDIASCYIKYTASGEYIFNGATFDTNDVHPHTEFMQTQWWPQPNSNGDYLDAMLVKSDYDYTYTFAYTFYYGFNTPKNYALCQAIGPSATPIGFGVSRLFTFPAGSSIEFSAGGTGSPSASAQGPYINLSSDENAPHSSGTASYGDYFGASTDPRTVSKANTKSGRVVFRTSEYSGAYAKISGATENLWTALTTT